jgi:phospholipid-translocating ATPase
MSEKEERASLYVFPSSSPSPSPSPNPVAQTPQVGPAGQEDAVLPRTMTNRTHARSASHGGVLASASRPASSNLMTVRPSALKRPGHQRAFSQGQVVEVPITGHSRVGSKTDFILPPGHREDGLRPSSAGRTPASRGHSRQASRSESIYTIRRSATPPWWRRAWARFFGFNSEEAQLRNIVPSHLLPPKSRPAVDNRYSLLCVCVCFFFFFFILVLVTYDLHYSYNFYRLYSLSKHDLLSLA